MRAWDFPSFRFYSTPFLPPVLECMKRVWVMRMGRMNDTFVDGYLTTGVEGGLAWMDVGVL